MPRPSRPLTVAEIDRAVSTIARGAAPRKDLRDGVTPGLRLRVGRKASVWDLSASVRGKRMTFILGVYPAVSLAAARDAARKKRDQLNNLAPEATAGAAPDTLRALLDYYGRVRGGQLRTWPEMLRSIHSVFSKHLDAELVRLDVGPLQRTADFYPAKNQAAHAVKSLRPILTFGRKRGFVLFQPDTLEMPPHNRVPRNRVLSDDELRAVFKALEDTPYDNAVRLLFLTACRKREVTEARWEEFDLDRGIWTIPPGRTKEQRAHVVQLSTAAQRLVARLPRTSEFLFGVPPTNWDRWQKQMFARSNTSGWHRHDIRRTAATAIARLGYAPPIIESILGHKDLYSPLATIYQAHRYDVEARAALDALASFYEKLMA